MSDDRHVDAAGQEARTEIGVRFTGSGGREWVEPHGNDPTTAQERLAMYQRKGDPAALIVTRRVITHMTAWQPCENRDQREETA
jgi:hypothetical protein